MMVLIVERCHVVISACKPEVADTCQQGCVKLTTLQKDFCDCAKGYIPKDTKCLGKLLLCSFGCWSSITLLLHFHMN